MYINSELSVIIFVQAFYIHNFSLSLSLSQSYDLHSQSLNLWHGIRANWLSKFSFSLLLSQFQLLLSFSSFFWFLIIISLILGQNFVLSELNFYKIFLDFSINLVSILFELNLHEIFLDFLVNSISTFSRILQDLIEFLWFFKLDWSPSYIAWCKCNSMVLAWLLNSLTKDIQASVIYFKSTRDLHIYNLDIQIDFPRLKLGTSRTALKKKIRLGTRIQTSLTLCANQNGVPMLLNSWFSTSFLVLPSIPISSFLGFNIQIRNQNLEIRKTKREWERENRREEDLW